MKISLETLPKATEQQVFNHVARHLLTQRKRSENPGRGCKYRSLKGLKCAAGALIGDYEYFPEMEGTRWGGLVDEGKVPEQHSDFIQELQDIHDNYPPAIWDKELGKLAKRSYLNADVIEEF